MTLPWFGRRGWRIGQERLRLTASRARCSSLDELSVLIDWHAITALLKAIHASAKGEAAWPPLAMFKALLLAVWYDLSDVKLAEALDRHSGGFAAFRIPSRRRSARPSSGFAKPWWPSAWIAPCSRR